MQRLSQQWDELCGLIIRPQRCRYELAHLGPPRFTIDGKIYHRVDSEVTNPRGLVLRCSHFEPTPSERPSERMPCVVYLHGNCGSRVDALESVTWLLPAGITVFSFDFSGSGMSDGEHVSLGYYEKQDLCAVVDYLHDQGRTSRIGFWGRSMGAVTAIMYASRDSSVGGIVCDSPFSSLQDIIQDIVTGYKSWIPRMAVRLAVRTLRQSILDRAQFDISLLDTCEYAKASDVPAIIAHGKEDTLVSWEHSQKVKDSYRGDHRLFWISGDHNSERPEYFYDAVTKFFSTNLKEKTLLVPRTAPQVTSQARPAAHVDPQGPG
eukprot:Hpha_TRINITY_DN8796_c0_g1::TRINITY_DN8796_c0_g1_i1::g.45266::m.45266